MSGYDLPPDTPGFAEAQALFAKESRLSVDLPGALLDLSYGSDPRQRFDVFPAGQNAPAILFLRGGYWKVGNKEERRFPANVWHKRGVTWIVANYRLAPIVSLAEIVTDADAFVRAVVKNADQFGIDPDKLHIVGNSAGAHLAAMVSTGELGHHIASMTLISGLFDLLPLLQEEANDWLQLDRAEAERLSPAHHLPPAHIPLTVCVGGDETDAFKAQSRDFAVACRAHGREVEHFEAPGQHHIGIIGQCGTPNTPVFDSLERRLALS